MGRAVLKLEKGSPRPRPAVLRMAPYSPPSAGRLGKLRLDFNENTVGASPRVLAALQKKLTVEHLAVYPEYTEARPALAQFLGVAPDQVLLTNGTDEAIQVLVNGYVDDAQEVIVLKPAYAMYRFYAELAGASVTEIVYEGDDLDFPTGRLLQAITPQTKAVLIANPNNPTGTAATVADLERVLKRARKAVVLVDEAYVEFCGISALPLVAHYPNLFVSRTFSKTYGMAAMRMGCLVSRAGNIAVLRKAQSPYSVNLLAAMAMQEAIRDQAYIRRYVAEVLAARELLCLGLDKLGIAYVPSQANFVLMRCGPRSVEVRDRLRERDVLVRDRSYEIAGCVRVTVGTREQTRRFLAALREIW